VIYTNQIAGKGSPAAMGELSDVKIPSESSNQGSAVPAIILSTAVADFLEVTAGQQVQLTFLLGAEKKEARFRVAAVYDALPGLPNFRTRVAFATGAGVLISLENFHALTQSAPSHAFQAFYFIKAGRDAKTQKAVARRIREQFDVRYQFGVQCTAEHQDQARVLYWATQVLFALLLGVAVVIAIFSLIASMTSTVLERQREIGVLKALGLRRRELFRLFLTESIVLTVSSAIAGGAIGFVLAWLFVLQASALMERPGTFTMPYLTFVALMGISIFAGAVAAYLPTRNLLRKSAAEILRS
jgi:ABC-type antimicrobial peptide transport system permease subunit